MLLLFTFIISLIISLIIIIYIKYFTKKTKNTTNTVYFVKPYTLPDQIQLYILAIDTIFNLKLEFPKESYLLYKINQLYHDSHNKNFCHDSHNKKIIPNIKDIEIWKTVCEKRKWKFIQN